MKKNFHILGGGISGLYTAKLLREKHPQSTITIYEQNSHLGGRCYSYPDKNFGTLDNATHAIIGANKNSKKLLKSPNFHKKALFFDLKTETISTNILKNKNEIALALFNNSLKKTPISIIWQTLKKLFPFTHSKTKIWFSQNNLTETIIKPLSHNADETKLGYLLKSFDSKNTKITSLTFNKETININPADTIISTLDAENSHKIFNTPKFEFESIINIFFKSEPTWTLPELTDFLAIKNGLTQWIFKTPCHLAVTISNVSSSVISNTTEESGQSISSILARQIWSELQIILNKKNVPMPEYKIIHHKFATIKQNQQNNSQRPTSAKTSYTNLILAGDWTLKNYPSSIETSILSAIRAVESID